MCELARVSRASFYRSFRNPAGSSQKTRSKPLAEVLVSYLANIPPEELRKLESCRAYRQLQCLGAA